MAKYGSTAAERLAAKRNNTKTVSTNPGGDAVQGGRNTVADIVAKAAGKKPATKTNSYTRPSSGSSAANPNLTAANDPRSYSKPTGGATNKPTGSTTRPYDTGVLNRPSSGSTTKPSGSSTPSYTPSYTPTYSGYNNGGLSEAQIRELQSYYGASADGKWGQNSTAAAGGLSAAEAWEKYQGGLQEEGDYETFLKRIGANDYESRLQSAVSAQVQQAVDDYNAQIAKAGVSFEDAARRAYINKMRAQRNMDQELAAGGVYGGMADSQRIATEAEYQNDLTELELQYNDTIDQLQRAITAARQAGNAQVAEQMANYLAQVQDRYAAYLEDKRTESRASGGGYVPTQQESTGGTQSAAGAGLQNYSAVKNNIMMYASRGMNAVSDRIIRQVWGQMSEAQRRDLNSTLRQNGWID